MKACGGCWRWSHPWAAEHPWPIFPWRSLFQQRLFWSSSPDLSNVIWRASGEDVGHFGEKVFNSGPAFVLLLSGDSSRLGWPHTPMGVPAGWHLFPSQQASSQAAEPPPPSASVGRCGRPGISFTIFFGIFTRHHFPKIYHDVPILAVSVYFYVFFCPVFGWTFG